jgi:hypothetical protein
MLKWLFPLKKTYIDENKVRLRKQIQDQIRNLSNTAQRMMQWN